MHHRLIRVRVAVLIVAASICLTAAPAAKQRPLELRRVSFELPGIPWKVISNDLNGDGRTDLVLVVALTEVESVAYDHVEEMMQVTTVIPSLFDRREARVYLANADGSYRPAGSAIPLDKSVLALERGFGDWPVLALTDDGVAGLRFDASSEPVLAFELLLDEPPVMAGSATFLPALEWMDDVDADGDRDLLFPAGRGFSIHLQTDGRIEAEPAFTRLLPGDRRRVAARDVPLPQVRDIDGDGNPDLVVWGRYSKEHEVHLFLGDGTGRFVPVYGKTGECELAHSALRFDTGEFPAWFENLTHLGDIDGDGHAELVTQEQVESEKTGLRAGMKEFKKPLNRYRFHHLTDGLQVEREPYRVLDAEGYSFQATGGPAEFLQFADLDDDGLSELITMTIDFSLLRAMKALATKRASLGLNFHVWTQHDGTFSRVPGLDLTEKIKIDLKRLSIGRFAQFAGDFDGDGKTDFVHFGRGKEITIHRGQTGCRYSARPDLAVAIEEEPQDLGMITVADFDRDGRADFTIIKILEPEREGESPPTRLDFYLSGP